LADDPELLETVPLLVQSGYFGRDVLAAHVARDEPGTERERA